MFAENSIFFPLKIDKQTFLLDRMSIGTQNHSLIMSSLFCPCDEISPVAESVGYG
jgi:hypothetical protein